MARKKSQGKRKRPSLFLSALNRFTAFVYALFGNSPLIGKLLSGEDLYKSSVCGGILERNRSNSSKLSGLRYADTVIEQSRVLRFTGIVREFFGCLGLNVYGLFFMAYSLSAIFIYYLSALLQGFNRHGISAVIVLLITFICSIPLMVTSRSLLSVLSDSKIARRVLIGFLGYPEENLKGGKQVNGPEFMFISAIFAVLLGMLTYFIHPAYVPMLAAVVIVICLCSASPEAGVVLTVAATPFLQFFEAAKMVLVCMIFITFLSYINKFVKRRRTVRMCSKTVILFLFCAIALAASTFSRGGIKTLWDAVLAMIIILGGFFLPYNLMRGKRRVASCVTIMTATYVILSLAGIWNLFYNGIADGVMYSIRENLSPIFDSNIIYIADSAEVFGVYTVLMAPFIFAYGSKQKNARGIASAITMIAILVASTMIYGSYEAVVAIIIEFCLFWMLYSHKSLTFLILAIIPMAAVSAVYPYFSSRFGWYDFPRLIEGMLPLPLSDSAAHIGAVESTLNMLKDGNFFGIGVGKHAFMTLYPVYSDAVSLTITDSPTLWLKVLCWSGIGGAIALIIFMIHMFCDSLGYIFRAEKRELRREILALFCSLFTAFLFGSVNGIWDDPRMLYLFWVCAGLLAGAVRDGREAHDRIRSEFANTEEHTDLELRF